MKIGLICALLSTGALVSSAQSLFTPRPTTKSPAAKNAAARQQEIHRISRLARDAESAGDFAHAVELWQSLRQLDPGNFSAYYGLRKCYSALERWDDGIKFLDEMASLSSKRAINLDEITIAVDRVEMLYQAGRNSEADIESERLLRDFSSDPRIYSQLSGLLVAQNKIEEAVTLLRRGREVIGNPHQFAYDLARWEEARMNWSAAAKEYLLYLQESPGRLEYVIGALGDMCAAGGEKIILEILQNESKQAKGAVKSQLQRLNAALLFRAGNYLQALDIYRQMDEGDNGAHLLQFAEMVAAEGEVELAIEAYRAVIQSTRSRDISGLAYLGLGGVFESGGNVDSAKSVYQSAVDIGVEPKVEFEILRRLGKIAAEVEDDPVRARDYFNRAIILAGRSNPPATVVDEVMIDQAMTWARQGELNKAMTALQSLVKKMQPFRYRPAADARWYLARIHLWRADRDAFITEINAFIASDAAHQMVNEALELSGLLQDVQPGDSPLNLLAKADYNLYKRDFSQLESVLLTLAASENPLFAEFALWKLANLYQQQRNATLALDVFERLIAMRSSLRRDQALFAAGELAIALSDTARALGYWESILTDHPESPTADKTRRRLKDLAGETL